MTCPERRVVTFLAGELAPDEAARFDEHLLGCESCWRAVHEDRSGRLAAEGLRESPPSGFADRIALAVELASADPAWHAARRRPGRAPRDGFPGGRRRALLVAASVAAVLAASLTWALSSNAPQRDPAQVAAVVSLAGTAGHGPMPGSAGRRMDVGGQSLMVHAYRLDGVLAVVATSSQPFPHPAASHMLGGSSSKAWMATRGNLALYCVNRPSGHQSMLLVAAMPAAELPQLAARLHFI